MEIRARMGAVDSLREQLAASAAGLRSETDSLAATLNQIRVQQEATAATAAGFKCEAEAALAGLRKDVDGMRPKVRPTVRPSGSSLSCNVFRMSSCKCMHACFHSDIE
jgi:hypothetical protein